MKTINRETPPRIGAIILCAVMLLFSSAQTNAFSLLGPFESWMQPTNGFQQPGDIGGPICLTNGYRWNVPVLTYGFDKSFLNYFGTNGVAAVAGAIQILNDLSPASQSNPGSYPLNVSGMNYTAASEALADLKSSALFLILEHLGLATPDRYTFCLRSFSITNGTITGNVITRNYDPISYLASSNVDGTLLDYFLDNYSPSQGFWTAAQFPVDAQSPVDLAVADGNIEDGTFFNSLTRDDVGGLCYLLSTNNVIYETLPPGVKAIGSDENAFVNGAWRPGVDKITFILQSVDSTSGTFLPMTNLFTDNFITNGNVVQQQLKRVITQPDFLFSATNLPPNSGWFFRTGTTNWLNNAIANGNSDGAGPGVIEPPVVIAFNIARQFYTSGNSSDVVAYDQSQLFGSFDGSTSAPVAYPIPQTGSNQMTFNLWLTFGENPDYSPHLFTWHANSAANSAFVMQTSTDLTHWTTLLNVTNTASVCTYFVLNPSSTSRFYRLFPQ